MGQNLYGLKDLPYAPGCSAHVVPGDEVKEAIKVIENFRGQFYARHANGHAGDQVLRLRAAGLRGL